MQKVKIHVTYMVILVLGIGLSVFSVVAIKGHRDHIQQDYAQKNEARMMCQTWADKLDRETIDESKFAQSEMELPQKDPWGRAIRFMHDRIGIRRTFRVMSYGPDGRIDTKDDIVETRHMMWKGE